MDRIDQIYSILLDLKEDSGHFKSELAEIKAEAKKTNGRVTKLEGVNFKAQLKDAKIMGILAVIVFLFSVASNILYNVIANVIASHIH